MDDLEQRVEVLEQQTAENSNQIDEINQVLEERVLPKPFVPRYVFARAQLSAVSTELRPAFEQAEVEFLLGFVKLQTQNKCDAVWDEAWALAAPSNAAFGDGQFLERLIRLIELLLPILLRILCDCRDIYGKGYDAHHQS